LRVLDHPSLRAHVLAGLALGAAIGTRYFLVTTVPVLLIADVILLRRSAAPTERRRLLRCALIALACVAIGFFVTTPYFFIDFATVLTNLAHEARTEHLGADGFGFAGNLRWYLTDALPASMSAPNALVPWSSHPRRSADRSVAHPCNFPGCNSRPV
jgi:hypothetical protein